MHMKLNKINPLVAIIAISTALSVSTTTVLADDISIKSYGKFEYDNDESDNNVDIVIDTEDLKTLEAEIQTANENIESAGADLDSVFTIFDYLDGSKDNAIYANSIADKAKRISVLNSLFADMQNSSNGAGTATSSDVLPGKTFTSKTGLLQSGSMKTKAAETYTPSTSSQTIPAGQYLTGAQTIKGDANLVAANIASGKSIFGVAGSYTSDATATEAQILSGKTAYSKGKKLSGTMVSKAGATVSASVVTESGDNALISIPTTGYYDTSSKISVPIETIKNNVSQLNSSVSFQLKLYCNRTIKSNAAQTVENTDMRAQINNLDVTNYKTLKISESSGAGTYTHIAVDGQTVSIGDLIDVSAKTSVSIECWYNRNEVATDGLYINTYITVTLI